jgi:hypothetical protein
MSLTVLLHREKPEVAILQWFKDPRLSITYPRGPVIRMNRGEFRSRGLDLIKQHTEQYAHVRLSKEDAGSVFEPAEERATLKNSKAISISPHYEGGLILGPLRFRGSDLSGLRAIGSEYYRVLQKDYTPAEFWNAFDAVLQDTP